jgi:hypothetical protein
MTNPFWFDRALATPSETGNVPVDGADIHFETWGERGRPGIVLVHGSNAHLEWWRFVAPFLADQFRVAALDSSGNGDSGWRERYSGEVLAQGSLGGLPGRRARAAPVRSRPQLRRLRGARDRPPLRRRPRRHRLHGFHHRAAGAVRGVGSACRARGRAAEARHPRLRRKSARPSARFRYVPEQPVTHPCVHDYIAGKSLRPVEGGWTWKFDPGLFDYLEMGVDQRDKFAAMACRSAVILGEDSADEGAFYADHMADITAGKLPIFKVPGTHHHLMFDDPIAVAMAIKGIVLGWIAEDGRAEMREPGRARQGLSAAAGAQMTPARSSSAISASDRPSSRGWRRRRRPGPGPHGRNARLRKRRQVDGRADQHHLAQRLVGRRLRHAEVLHLRVLERLTDVVDGPAGHAGGVQAFHQLGHGEACASARSCRP